MKLSLTQIAEAGFEDLSHEDLSKGSLAVDGSGNIFMFFPYLSRYDGDWKLKVKCYNHANDSWTNIERSGQLDDWFDPLYYHSATFDPITNKVILFGGLDMKRRFKSNDLWIFDPVSKTFAQKRFEGPLGTRRRSNHQSLMVGSKLVILSGLDEKAKPLDGIISILDLEETPYHPAAWQNIKLVGPWPRIEFGNCQATNDGNHGTIWALDRTGSFWKLELGQNHWTLVQIDKLSQFFKYPPSLVSIGKQLFFTGEGRDEKFRALMFDTKIEKLEPVEFTNQDVMDNVESMSGRCRASLENQEVLTFISRLKGQSAYHVFNLSIEGDTVQDDSQVRKHPDSFEESHFSHMMNILSTGIDSDMALIVGKHQTKVAVHKNMMRMSPLVDRFLNNNPATNEVQIQDCELFEVREVLKHIYVANFPLDVDWKVKLKLFNAASKFELFSLAKKSADKLKEEVQANPVVFAEAFKESSGQTLPFALDLMVQLFSQSKEMKQIYKSLASDSTYAVEADLLAKLLSIMPVADQKEFTEEDPDDKDDTKKCTVCFEELKSPFQSLIPCGHASNCSECVENIRKRSNKCPLCRADIVSVHPVYL